MIINMIYSTTFDIELELNDNKNVLVSGQIVYSQTKEEARVYMGSDYDLIIDDCGVQYFDNDGNPIGNVEDYVLTDAETKLVIDRVVECAHFSEVLDG